MHWEAARPFALVVPFAEIQILLCLSSGIRGQFLVVEGAVDFTDEVALEGALDLFGGAPFGCSFFNVIPGVSKFSMETLGLRRGLCSRSSKMAACAGQVLGMLLEARYRVDAMSIFQTF